MTTLTSEDFSDLLTEDLSGVTFVRDYLQLQFNPPPILNAYTPVTVAAGGHSAEFGERAFANLVIGQIGKHVVEVDLVLGQYLLLIFEDESTISISLREEDLTGPEAIYMQGREDRSLVVRIDDVPTSDA